MTDEEDVLVSEGDEAEVFHVPLGATTFPRCGRNAQQDVDFQRVPRSDAAEDHRQCQRCPFDTTEESSEEQLIADGSGHEVRLDVGRHQIAAGVEAGDARLSVAVPRGATPGDLEDALEAAIHDLERELEHARDILPNDGRHVVRTDGGDHR